MSVSETAHRPANRGRGLKLWTALIAVIAAGIALAWVGASPLRGEVTDSGLRIRTVKQGTGPFVQQMDGVILDYEARLTDGTVFDSSASHGGPQPMLPSQVIPGFSEALTKMQKDGKYKVRIPAKLAYGESPPQGSPIPANADLDFDVHIVQIVPNAALMAGSGAPQPQNRDAGPPLPEPEGAPAEHAH